MSDYLSVVYGDNKKTYYPYKLIAYLISRCGIKTGGKVLDIGCGLGEHLDAFRAAGLWTEGVDAVSVEERDSKHDVKIKNINGYMDLQDSRYDVVFMKSILEHLKDPVTVLDQAGLSLKKNGILIIMVPSWKHQFKKFYDDPTHITPYTARGLSDFLKINGWNVLECEIFTQLPWLWGRPYLKPFVWFLSLFTFIKCKTTRFAQEKMILAIARKS